LRRFEPAVLHPPGNQPVWAKRCVEGRKTEQGERFVIGLSIRRPFGKQSSVDRGAGQGSVDSRRLAEGDGQHPLGGCRNGSVKVTGAGVRRARKCSRRRELPPVAVRKLLLRSEGKFPPGNSLPSRRERKGDRAGRGWRNLWSMAVVQSSVEICGQRDSTHTARQRPKESARRIKK